MSKQDDLKADELTESVADLELATQHAEQTKAGAATRGGHADGDILLVFDFTQGP